MPIIVPAARTPIRKLVEQGRGALLSQRVCELAQLGDLPPQPHQLPIHLLLQLQLGLPGLLLVLLRRSLLVRRGTQRCTACAATSFRWTPCWTSCP